MSSKTLSFLLVTLSLGFTAFAFSQVPMAEPELDPLPMRAAAPSQPEPGYRHLAARARNGSTHKSTAQASPADAGAIWDPLGTGNGGASTGLDNGLDGGESGAGSGGDQKNLPHR